MQRCHACDSRFVQFGGSLIRVAHLRGAFGNITLAAVVLLAVAAVLAAILLIDRAQSSPTTEFRWTSPVPGSRSRLVC